MITNFEKITAELNDFELSMINDFIVGFQKHKKENPIKAPDIVEKYNKFKGKKYISEPRLRKIVNYIRSNGLLPLIATSDGYYVSQDVDEIEKQIKSLRERAYSILRCANGLEKYINK